MKAIRLMTLALLTLMNLPLIANAKDQDGHVLTKLWANYDKAEDEDRPKDQVRILEQIKKEATDRHLAWDFYDASTKYLEVRSDLNWKDREGVYEKTLKEMERFGEPIVLFFFRQNDEDNYIAYSIFLDRLPGLLTYVREHRAQLERAHNTVFYEQDLWAGSPTYGKALVPLIRNDYEFALWSLLGAGNGQPWVRQIIEAFPPRSYPADAFLEFTLLQEDKDTADAAYEKYAADHAGQAVALLARDVLLERRFRKLNQEDAPSQEAYRQLARDCEALQADRKKFSGSEKAIADCCGRAGWVLDNLNDQDIRARIEDGVVTLFLRNLPQVRVTITPKDGEDKKPVFDRTIANTRRSFYIQDTLVFDLPRIDDGSYVFRCEEGKAKFQTDYDRFTLSIAIKRDYNGYGVYVADYITGEPVSRCDITVLRDDKPVEVVKDLPIDGFTYLPERIVSELDQERHYYRFQATLRQGGLTRTSGKESFYSRAAQTVVTDNPARHHAEILTDRSAFLPGETVHFKVLLYEGTYEFATRPEGIRLHATLTDPSDKTIGEADLVTGEFGSAAGSFVLKKGERGGMYTITVSEDGKQIASTSVRADEFVLPTFSLDWEPDQRFYFEQDEVTVRGNVKSYSGHSLGTATARYEVRFDDKTLADGPLTLDASGDFAVRFVAPETRYYYGGVSICVTVTDGTGETLSFAKTVYIRRSLNLSIDIQNPADGRVQLLSQDSGGILVGDDFVRTCFQVNREGEDYPTLKISYKILRGTSTVLSGEAPADRPVNLSLAGLPSGPYTIEAIATAKSDNGKEYTQKATRPFIKCSDTDTVLDADVRCFFKELPDDGQGIALQVGTTTGPIWVVAELYGDGNRLLEKRMVRLAGVRGQAGSLETVRFARKRDYPETLTLEVFWFRNRQAFAYTVSSFKPAAPFQLPLGFSRFLDTTLPHADYQFTIRTGAGTEVAATIFDKSTEVLQDNHWYTFLPEQRPLPHVVYAFLPGNETSFHELYFATSTRGVRSLARADGIASNAAPAAVEEEVFEAYAQDDALGEHVILGYSPNRKSNLTGSVSVINPVIRSNFANTIAWEPFLRADENGEVTFRFTTADKLSTYYVQLFAHDKAFHNATLRQEMVVTLPVKVAVVQPQYLYEGDKYVARVSVANSLDAPVSGRINVCFLDGKDHKTAPLISEQEQALTVPAGGSADFSCSIAAPAVADLGLLVSFIADEADYGSDAVFVTLPVKPAVQTITEAHSALMLSWMDREAILTALRGQFVNVPGSAASLREITILDMIREAIPEKVLPTSDNLLDQSEALFANWLLDRLPDAKGSGATPEQRAEMCAKILGCRNEDGGFGWFAEMHSSPLLTCVLLERLAAMGDTCPQELAGAIPAAVKYLDDRFFSDAARPFWCGGISLEQYLHTRSLFPEVAFEPKADAKTLRTFKKRAKEYLVPGKVRGLNGMIFAKARRMKTLRALLENERGTSLAHAWGISLLAKGRLAKSLDKDVASLLQYAQPHSSGGTYYPNAVMPWRGLLESELYAHTLIADLLTDCGHDAVAEGIRLWMMVQKETQQWEDDPAYIQAIDCVLRGSEETLQTKVLALSATTTLPFRQVKAAGNGFTVSRTYTRDGKPLQDGDVLHVGDRITATYHLWNEENRSFVRLSVPRPAAFRPVEQRSGRMGWFGRPISITGWVSFSPQGYRSVLADRTEFWFDSYPEEKTEIVEEFFVTQEGTFQSPVPVIESLYAPHYRANDAGHPAVTVEP